MKDARGSLVESGTKKAGSLSRGYALARKVPGRADVALGELFIEIDSRKILSDVGGQVFVSLVFQVLCLFVESFIVLLLFARMVTRHLSKIAVHIEEFEVRPGAPPLTIDKRDVGDELDVLVRSFNAMHRNLEASRVAELHAMDELARSLREKKVLLQEVYHRTKNNMQLIASFLSMQAGSSGDERFSAMIDETIGRISSMALVHQKLYESKDLSRIDLADYLKDLLSDIRRAYLADRPQVEIVLQAEPGIVALFDLAIPCGLALNELVVNAVKYAFPEGRRGTIRVGLSRGAAGAIALTVSDDGVGFPPGFDARRDGGIGLQTVVSLLESQLRGTVAFGSGPGASCVATIRDDVYSARV